MEHRHFPRKPTDLAVQIRTYEGNTYQGHILETSAVGMRVSINDRLPERVKLVNVVLPTSAGRYAYPAKRLQMFVAWRNEYELGLCLVNEQAKIDIDCHETAYFMEHRMVGNR